MKWKIFIKIATGRIAPSVRALDGVLKVFLNHLFQLYIDPDSFGLKIRCDEVKKSSKC